MAPHTLVVLTSICLPSFCTALEVVHFATRAYPLESDSPYEDFLSPGPRVKITSLPRPSYL